MKDLPPLPTTPTSAKAWNVNSSPKTPLRPSPTPHQSRYSHPYGIKSTSSGVLSSAAVSSSPNNAISAHSYQQHKSSKSMHSLLRNSSSVDDLAGSGEFDLESPVRRQRHRNDGIVPGMKYDSINTRKRTLAQRASMSDLSGIAHDGPPEGDRGVLASPRKRVTELREEWSRAGVIRGEGGVQRENETDMQGWREVLPDDPRQWTTAQLATFIGSSLTRDTSHVDFLKNEGSPGRNSENFADTPSRVSRDHHHGLHPAVVEDIKLWIRRSRLDGKAFIRGAESDWAASENPPPFLPILLSLSAELRDLAWTNGTQSGTQSSHGHFSQHSKTSAHDRLDRDTGVLRETNENKDPHGSYLESVVIQPHVREVVNLIDQQIYDEAQSPFLTDIGHDIFSPQARLKSRTLSSTSSRSGISVFSSDASEGVCVSERAAIFESGEAGRRNHKTAEEREGRVLERDSSSEVVSAAQSTVSPESASEEDVFGATIRPPKITRLSGGSRDKTVSGNALNPAATNFDTTMGDLSKADTVGTRHMPKLALEGAERNDSSQVTELACNTGIAFESAMDHGSKGHPTATQAEDAQSSHMSHMIAHEQAGHKPYGALRRAHSTPVPRLTEQQKRYLNGTESPLTAGVGLRTVSSCLDSSPRQDLGTRIFSQGSLQRPHDGNVPRGTPSPLLPEGKDTSKLVSFNLLKNSKALELGERANDASSIRDQAVSRETTECLAIAEARITELERLLAKALEENMTLQKQSPSAENASAKSEATDGDHLLSSDVASTTILWRWFAVPQSLSAPFAIRLGPLQTLGQLPAYVFLVGVGLSVTVARVVLARNLTRGK